MKRKKLTTAMYLRALGKDNDTIALLRRNSSNTSGLDTKEKRACFRVGHDAGYHAITGKFSHPDQPGEKFHGWRALHPQQATSDDAYFATLGVALSEAWK